MSRSFISGLGEGSDVTVFAPKDNRPPLTGKTVDGEVWVKLDELIEGFRKQGHDEAADVWVRYRDSMPDA